MKGPNELSKSQKRKQYRDNSLRRKGRTIAKLQDKVDFYTSTVGIRKAIQKACSKTDDPYDQAKMIRDWINDVYNLED